MTGTLVGAFFGVQIGSMGREQEREERKEMETMTMQALVEMDPRRGRDFRKEMEEE